MKSYEYFAFLLTFHQTQKEGLFSNADPMINPVLIGMVLLIIEKMFYGIIILNLVHLLLLLLLPNLVNGFRLELMYLPLIVNIKSCLKYLHGFQLLVLLPCKSLLSS